MSALMTSSVRQLVAQGDKLFEKRRPMEQLWQVMAENFNPLRADFTTTLNFGEDFAANLFTGRPLLAQRDLGNAISSMLRPRGKQWVHARTLDERIDNDAAARRGLDAVSERMQRIFYFQSSHFIRATKQADSDFVTFGQAVITPEVSRDRRYILYRAWHLRDVVWCEDAELKLKRVDRNWKVEAYELEKMFPGKLAQKVQDAMKKDPYIEVKCRHIVLPADEYDLSSYGNAPVNKSRFPFVSLVVDIENEVVLEELPRRRLAYVIPRWVTPSGSQYAHSPATVVALPEARTLQQITLTLLESGQKAVDPPMKATREAVQGGVNLYAGAVTWVDAEYDERQGSAIEPIWKAPPALEWGDRREEKIERLIQEAFFLNKINLPVFDNKERTMFEVSKMMDDYIRGALPLFEPIEVEYNGALCEETFQLGLDHGAFADVFAELPQILQGRDVQWTFESPLQTGAERAKAEAFVTASNLLSIAAQQDPGSRRDFDTSQAFRDALIGAGAPASWVVPKEQADQAKQADQQAATAAQAMQVASAGAEVAGKTGGAIQQLQQVAQTERLQQAGVGAT